MARPVKRRRLSPTGSDDHVVAQSNGGPDTDHWDVEQAYEQRPRSRKVQETTRLPIKTSEGWVAQVAPQEEVVDDTDSFLDSEDGHGLEGEIAGSEHEEDEGPQVPPRQQVIEAKEELARLAGLLTEDPETHVGALRDLAKLSLSKNPTVKKLALATQCTVYRDLIPGYRIRPLSEADMKEKLSKDVKKLREYEQGMVKTYQGYVQQLETLSRASRASEDPTISTVALSCACTLLVERPHFNFRTHLLAILVRRLGRKTANDDYRKCIDTIQTLFRNDEEGHVSLDAVSAITKLLKSKDYNVNELALNTFLHLRLISEFAGTGSHDRVDKTNETEEHADPARNKKQFRTKKERKHLRELKKVQKEMKDADATVSREDRNRIQGEILKLVFATYFRILKLKPPGLMGATLEGLAKYAHLINQDFFGDIVESLKELIQNQSKGKHREDSPVEDFEEEVDDEESSNITREVLLCVITAFALLQGQHGRAVGSTLTLDLDFFVAQLYQSLYPAAVDGDIELSSKSLHLPDPDAGQAQLILARKKINLQTTTVLLIRSLSSVLLPTAAIRAVPPLRIAAFTKQLFTVALQLPEKSCLAMLSLLERVAKLHGRRISALWYSEERRGDGVFDPLKAEIEGSNPFASTIWEGELLRLHYAPKVRQTMKLVKQQIASV